MMRVHMTAAALQSLISGAATTPGQLILYVLRVEGTKTPVVTELYLSNVSYGGVLYDQLWVTVDKDEAADPAMLTLENMQEATLPPNGGTYPGSGNLVITQVNTFGE